MKTKGSDSHPDGGGADFGGFAGGKKVDISRLIKKKAILEL